MVLASRLRFRPVAPLTCTAILLFGSGCATAWARGIVRDEAGRQVPAAEIAMSAAGVEAVSARGVAESNGCFSVVAPAKKKQSEFVLTVVAPGYKPVSMRFRQKDRFTALVTLAPEGGPGDGSAVEVAESALYKVYEEPCIPPVPHAASSLTLH